jgi:hypothetical protein
MPGTRPTQPSHEYRQRQACTRKHRATPGSSAAAAAVFDNQDILACILGHAKLNPFEFVAAGRVGTAWHDACMTDDMLLLSAARKPDFLTKRTLMGLFGLHWHEADQLPRGMKARRNGGWLWMYSNTAIECVMPMIGGVEGWRLRIARRAAGERLGHGRG